MKKLGLLFVILSASQLYGMESNLFLSLLYESCSNALTESYSYIASWLGQPNKKYQLIQALEKDKNDFEHKLQFKPAHVRRELNGPLEIVRSEQIIFNHAFAVTLDILIPSINFLRYSYYQKFHTGDTLTFASNLQALIACQYNDLPLLEECRKEEINGYSAIGAAIIAPDISIESKRDFIRQLILLGFKPTKKDIMLAELTLYNAIPDSEKEKIILFLMDENLVPDVKKKIVNCMIEPYRQAFWPLPDNANEK